MSPSEVKTPSPVCRCGIDPSIPQMGSPSMAMSMRVKAARLCGGRVSVLVGMVAPLPQGHNLSMRETQRLKLLFRTISACAERRAHAIPK